MADIIPFPRWKCGPGRPWLGSHTIIRIDTPERRKAVKARVRISKALELHVLEPWEAELIDDRSLRSIYAVDL